MTTNLAFGSAALIVPSVIGSKVIFVYFVVQFFIFWPIFLKFNVKV